MVRRLNTEEFIAKAKKVHGGRYNYERVEYLGSQTKVLLICREHGPFSITPGNHLNGKGCAPCGMRQRAKSKTKTTPRFVQEASQIHGDRYDYTKVIYAHKERGVTIVCRVHGDFQQKPCVHLMGSGCPLCGLVTISQKKRSTQAEFIAQARAKHGERYDYSLVNYQGTANKVVIVCRVHGPFDQLPSDHTKNGSGCPPCGGVWRYGVDEFIRRAREMHGAKYSYDNVVYRNARSKVEIVCPAHGAFQQPPHHHINGVGCPGCKADKISQVNRLTHQEFLERAAVVHEGRYDYSQTDYDMGHSKIVVGCPDHGPFTIEARVHIHQGTGCPECAVSGFKIRQSALLYYLRVSDNDRRLYKIGITNRTVDERFSLADLSRIVPVRIWEYKFGQDALDRETEILRAHRHLAYVGAPVLDSGNSELFVSDVLNLDH